MTDPVLSLDAYLLGSAWVVVTGGAAWVAARRARTAWIRAPRGPTAAVAEAVLVVLHLTLVGQVLGGLAALRPIPYLVAIVTTAGAVVLLVDPGSDLESVELERHTRRAPTLERILAATAVGAVGLQWIDHTLDALSRGMTHADTLWYHAPYSARFLQMGSLGDLGTLGYGQSRYFPLGAELLHTIAALPFHRDLLSPVVNLGFGALALVAAASVGARWGAGALGVAATAMVLGLPTLAGTQPGQASNDVVAAALVLSSIALWLHAERRSAPAALAGAALGLAIGTKVTVLALAGPLVVGGYVIFWRARRPKVARWWVVGVIVPSLFWPLRNLLLVGTPVPWLDLRLGPWHHRAIAPPSGTPNLVRSLIDGSAWSYTGGLRAGFGPLWLVVLLLFVGAVIGLAAADGRVRVLAATAMVGAVAYTFTPFTGGASFQFNLRYLTPPLLLAAVLAVVTAAHRSWARRLLVLALAAVLTINLFAEHRERVAAWSGHALGASLVLAACAGLYLALRSGQPRRRVGAAAVLLLVLAGWPIQRSYLEDRYVHAGLHDDLLNAEFRTVSGQTVAVLGTPEVYPMFGADLSNVVTDLSSELFLDVPAPADPCRHWRSTLRGTQRLAVSAFGFAMRRVGPDELAQIVAGADGVRVVVQDRERTIIQITEVLEPDDCPVPTAGA